MIIGNGVDLVNITRFRDMPLHRLNQLANHILTLEELTEFKNAKHPEKYIAKIWAIKEAVSKAFGTGINSDVTWKSIHVSKTALGQPIVNFKNKIADTIGSNLKCSVSVSYSDDLIIANAIIY